MSEENIHYQTRFVHTDFPYDQLCILSGLTAVLKNGKCFCGPQFVALY